MAVPATAAHPSGVIADSPQEVQHTSAPAPQPLFVDQTDQPHVRWWAPDTDPVWVANHRPTSTITPKGGVL